MFSFSTRKTVSQDEALLRVRQLLTSRLSGKPIRICEAGGGSLSVLPLSSFVQRTVTAVDIDPVQLSNNAYADTKVLGDIQTYSFPPKSFDLIVCYNVIEHLDFVDRAIEKFQAALVDGGVLFIGAPNPASLSGAVTKFSPHWFHVWFYKAVLKRKDAGQPGKPPFRTVYHRLVSPNALIDFCARLQLNVIYFQLYRSTSFYRLSETRPIISAMLSAATSVINALTLGQYDVANGDYHIVFVKHDQG